MRRALRRLSGPCLALWFTLVAAQSPPPPPPPPAMRVLMLASFDPALPSQRHLEEGMASVLRADGGRHALFVEYLDAARLGMAGQQPMLGPYLAGKYGQAGIGALVASSTQAAEFLASQPALLAGARRIYSDLPEATAQRIRAREPAATVIAEQSHAVHSLREAMRLLGPRRLVVVAQTRDAAGQERLAQFRRAAAEVLPPQVHCEYWIDRPLAELVERSARLDPGTALYFLLVFDDGAGALLTPYEAAQRITARASVPMVSQWETLVGSGVVGGHMVSQRRLGEHIARALLAGSAAAGQTTPVREGMRHVYDARQLRRWGLDEQALPAGSLVLFREPSALERYRGSIIGAGLVFTALVAMLLMLVVSSRGRQRALAELAQERSQLAQRVAERTVELDLRVAELARRNDELTMMKTQLAQLAGTDGLTGLANRRRFDEVLATELRRQRRSGASLALLMLDVDHFKAYNDHFGHLEGDNCLRTIAELLASVCRRPGDLAARFGGEEFVLVLPDTTLAGARLRAQQLLDALAALALPHPASPVAAQVTVSVGVVAACGARQLSPPALLALADALLYQAKSEGRARLAAAEA